MKHFNKLQTDQITLSVSIYEGQKRGVKFFLASGVRSRYHFSHQGISPQGPSRGTLMVTGFNTDIKHHGVVLHIQTELRKEGGIETTVYMRGAVIHSMKTSQREFAQSPEYTDEKFTRMLEDQHRQVIARIRANEIQLPVPSAPKA